MIVLIAFATVEGHSRTIAGKIGEIVEQAGHQVVIADLSGPGFAVPGRFDATILCGPIHVGKYPSPLYEFIGEWKSELSARPSALVTVSLAIASDSETERNEARHYPEKLAVETGWKADMEHNAAGALKYVEYDFFKRWVLRYIASKEGGPVDTTMDHVLTDWEALDRFVHEFLAVAANRLVGAQA